MKLDVTKLLEHVLDLGASDLHLSIGSKPIYRLNTKLLTLEDYAPLTVTDVEFILSQLLDEQQKGLFEINREIDFSVGLGTKARFRVNAFYQKGYPSIALRVIPMIVPSVEELNLPPNLVTFSNLKQGLFLVVGPTGHGKSTTIAALIDKINQTRAEHIITIEDPIEYVFTSKLSLIEQREMYLDTHSWDVALKSILRQDPNVVLIGEMRDAETMEAALRIAETGHLVFATLHTNSAAQTVDRIIASFPESKRNEVRLQLSQVIEVIISQRLIYTNAHQEGVLPAVEILLGTDAVRNLIREGKTHMLSNTLNTGTQLGMVSMERSLATLVVEGKVVLEEAMKFTDRPDELQRLVSNLKR